MLRHPADGSQWRKINREFPDFPGDARNLRFGLSTNGMNPFGEQSCSHSTWPVTLCIYNLPHWLCMKRKFIMMLVLIQEVHYDCSLALGVQPARLRTRSVSLRETMERDLEKEYIIEDIIRDDDDITSLYLNQSGEGDEQNHGDGSDEGDEQDHHGDGSGEGEGDDSDEGEADGAEVYIY
ncbi:hypothetical protein QYE76_017498 [Lolium multiflorum]|uniref:Uncharacterized protein n=1 Tax=Lolium multiflorum TaxID=4521 RepID=A0AAD8QA51_LOLMU|nr:hypothetical protein QYE76_017498 [Lolium multiflorum]